MSSMTVIWRLFAMWLRRSIDERGLTMKRLTKRMPESNGAVYFSKDLRELTNRLATIEDILGDDYDLDSLRDLVKADRDGKCGSYVLGQKVWVVERNEIAVPCCVSSFVFISEVKNVAIVHPLLAGGCGDLYSILHYCLEESRENYSCGIMAYPIYDCYGSYEDAKEAMEAEMREE